MASVGDVEGTKDEEQLKPVAKHGGVIIPYSVETLGVRTALPYIPFLLAFDTNKTEQLWPSSYLKHATEHPFPCCWINLLRTWRLFRTWWSGQAFMMWSTGSLLHTSMLGSGHVPICV